MYACVQTIVEERDQERERRWKAEQAVRKLTEELKCLQTKVSDEKDLQSMALHTTDRLEENWLNACTHTGMHAQTGIHTHNTCSHAYMHTKLRMNRFSSSKADIMMKGIIELLSVDFSCQMHNGFSSISTLFIFILRPGLAACLILEQ